MKKMSFYYGTIVDYYLKTMIKKMIDFQYQNIGLDRLLQLLLFPSDGFLWCYVLVYWHVVKLGSLICGKRKEKNLKGLSSLEVKQYLEYMERNRGGEK